jgi:hypothetical protein
MKLTRTGSKVSFFLSDVFLPNAVDLQQAFGEEEVLEGTVIGFSDSGRRQNAFAVVEVVQKRVVIIAVERLRAPRDGDGAEAGNRREG